MTGWLLEPRDPLVVRDGRPNERRSESETLPFPLPSTCAGVCRTQLGSDPGRGFVLGARLEELRQTSLRGPLLANIGGGGALLFPAPRDVRVERTSEGKTRVRALSPLATPSGAHHDDLEGLALVGPAPEAQRLPGKPLPGLPSFWPWATVERSLQEPPRLDGQDADDFLTGCTPALHREARLHVALDEELATAREGVLFKTAGLRFTTGDPKALSSARSLALFLDFDAASLPGRAIAPGLAPFGGKRRLVRWTPAENVMLPALPKWLVEHVERAAPEVPLRLRVILATPALFSLGYRPTPGKSPLLPQFASLVAVLTPRPETVSGWDFALGVPKPSRRMMSAGSVLWIDLRGDQASRLAWLRGVWMQNVSDEEQDRRDGFGLALVGVGS